LYSIVIEFVRHTELVGLDKMCLNETCKVDIVKNLSDAFPVQKGSETRRCLITSAFQLCFRMCHQEGPRKQRIGIECNISAHGVCCLC